MISPTDLFHPPTAPHFKTFQVFLASETWTLSKANEWGLSLFKRKVLRCIFGAKQGTKYGEKI
jgi:hypothetical protein